MVISNHQGRAGRIKRLALHGMSKDAWKRFNDEGYQHYYVEEAGYKYNMMDIQAAIGIHQLKRIEKNWSRRKEIWNYYNDKFSELTIILPEPPEKNTRHAYHLYTILIDEKIAGSLHFTPGNAYDDACNGNKSEVHWDLVLIQRPEYGGGTIRFDGEVIRKDGLFVADSLLDLNPDRLIETPCAV